MSNTGDIIRGAGGYLSRNNQLGVGIGPPHGGDEGDIRVQMVDGSPKLYAKAGGQWYGINLQASTSSGGVGDEFILGGTADHIKITPESGLEVISDYAKVAKLGTTLRIGKDSTTTSAFRVASDGAISIGTSAVTNFAVSASGVVTVGTSSGGATWNGSEISLDYTAATDDAAAIIAQAAIDAMEAQVVLGDTQIDIMTENQSPDFKLARFGSTIYLYDGTANENVKLEIAAAGIKLYGDNSTTYTHVDTNGIRLYDNSVLAATFQAGGAIIGNATTNDLSRLVLTSGALQFVHRTGDSDTVTAQLTAAGVFNVADINLTGKITLTGTDNNICIGVGQTDLGDDNVSIGKNAGAALASGGNDNVFIGTSAGLANATGDNNIAIGVGALLVANEGVSVPSYNVCIGTGAGKDITIGGLNICLGAFSGAADTVFTDGTDIITGASNTCIGNFSGTKNSNDDRSISIGYGTVGNGSDTCTIKALDGTFLQGGTTSSATGFDVASILSLDSVHGSIVDGDVLGAIQFRSTGETSDGSDALLPGAAIWAEAEDTFSSINNSTALVFATADSETALTSANEKMRINNDGRLGIGSNDPDSHVHIKDTATSNTTAALHVECTEINVDAGDTLLWLAWSSDSAVSSTANWIKFHDADGEIGVLESTSTNIDTTFTQTSDIRYKKNITDTSLEGLTTLNKIKIRDFEWNDKRGASRDGVEVTAGFIADEVYEFYPAATKGTPGAMKDILDEDGNKTGEEIDAMGIMEGAFIRLLMKAVQELSAKMDTMQTEINTLKEG